ncbi:hypothetical protein AMATHDRAFT_137868 [Amanita thiersii Skay4041]|uniref:CoA-transferase family III n=1 Tax=Amanita thiersii Skay4041 TaxID=703135 RepID=A0A2A9NZE1_9AGAR|nr:hypothetical protein AMATHDRAFT_137868 [Amanita thiersii Skay4041]
MTYSSKEAIEALWLSLGLPNHGLSYLSLIGNPDLAINSSFRLGVAAQTSVALSGLSAAHLFALRTGLEQDVIVDARHSVLAFHSQAWYTIEGQTPPQDFWDPIAGLYKTQDNNYIRIHTNFPHHRQGILSILDLEDTPSLSKQEVAQAILQWKATDLEAEAASRGMCAIALRSFDEWDRHPHAQALRETPPVMICKIGEAPKRVDRKTPTRPLEGIRVLDLTRVLAGPIAGRTLAAHGADTLLITSSNLPSLPTIDVETSLGKRTTQLDLTNPANRAILYELVGDADVFLQAYRPGGLEEKGFGVAKLAALHPGIVCANLTAWGCDGPWKDRRGFDSLVQTATGFSYEEGMAYQEYLSSKMKSERENCEDDALGGETPSFAPKPFPMQAIDHAAGYFLAFGIHAALARTITEGGSWEVRVSLAGVGQWIRSLGRVLPEEGFGRGKKFPSRGDLEIERMCVTWSAVKDEKNDDDNGSDGYGAGSDGVRRIQAIRHPAVMSMTPVREGSEGLAALRLDGHEATWLDWAQR